MVNNVHPTVDLRLLYDLAAMQHGVVGRTQLIASGMSWRAVDRRLQSEELKRLFPGVYAFRATPESYDQLLAAACLWSSGHASHRAAAAKHDLPGIARSGIIEISTSRTLSHRGLIVHKRSPLPACDLTRVDGVPVTATHRTLLDLGAVGSERAVEIALDDALRRGLTSLPQLRWHLGNAGGRGVRGTAVIRRILEARQEDRGACHSPLETIARRLLREVITADTCQAVSGDRLRDVPRTSGFRISRLHDRDRGGRLGVSLGQTAMGKGPQAANLA
jgi:hypothetical protein